MAMRKKQNLGKYSQAEEWMNDLLKKTDYKWSRQARWGWRLFDFWNHTLGIAVEVDGREHNSERDKLRDSIEWDRSRIVIYRVPNFDQQSAVSVLEKINRSETWNERRIKAGMDIIKT